MNWQIRYVSNRRYTIPAASVRDTEEEREQPQPKRGGGEALSMVAQQVKHGFCQAMRLGTNTAVSRLTVTPAQVPDAYLCSLAPSLQNHCHGRGNHDDKQDRHPDPAVSTHPAHAQHTVIHHLTGLPQCRCGSQHRCGPNSSSK
jgi:hypothetical protein